MTTPSSSCGNEAQSNTPTPPIAPLEKEEDDVIPDSDDGEAGRCSPSKLLTRKKIDRRPRPRYPNMPAGLRDETSLDGGARGALSHRARTGFPSPGKLIGLQDQAPFGMAGARSAGGGIERRLSPRPEGDIRDGPLAHVLVDPPWVEGEDGDVIVLDSDDDEAGRCSPRTVHPDTTGDVVVLDSDDGDGDVILLDSSDCDGDVVSDSDDGEAGRSSPRTLFGLRVEGGCAIPDADVAEGGRPRYSDMPGGGGCDCPSAREPAEQTRSPGPMLAGGREAADNIIGGINDAPAKLIGPEMLARPREAEGDVTGGYGFGAAAAGVECPRVLLNRRETSGDVGTGAVAAAPAGSGDHAAVLSGPGLLTGDNEIDADLVSVSDDSTAKEDCLGETAGAQVPCVYEVNLLEDRAVELCCFETLAGERETGGDVITESDPKVAGVDGPITLAGAQETVGDVVRGSEAGGSEAGVAGVDDPKTLPGAQNGDSGVVKGSEAGVDGPKTLAGAQDTAGDVVRGVEAGVTWVDDPKTLPGARESASGVVKEYEAGVTGVDGPETLAGAQESAGDVVCEPCDGVVGVDGLEAALVGHREIGDDAVDKYYHTPAGVDGPEALAGRRKTGSDAVCAFDNGGAGLYGSSMLSGQRESGGGVVGSARHDGASGLSDPQALASSQETRGNGTDRPGDGSGGLCVHPQMPVGAREIGGGVVGRSDNGAAEQPDLLLPQERVGCQESGGGVTTESAAWELAETPGPQVLLGGRETGGGVVVQSDDLEPGPSRPCVQPDSQVNGSEEAPDSDTYRYGAGGGDFLCRHAPDLRYPLGGPFSPGAVPMRSCPAGHGRLPTGDPMRSI